MNGVIVIDKPQSITSHDVILRLRKFIKVKRIGHGGTLDPLASGVLPIFIGEATKAIQFLSNEDKVYKGRMIFGIDTDTLDITGKILRRSTYIPSPEDILRVIEKFRGSIKQIPPMYSAVKVKGSPLYKLARKGIDVERAPREIHIFDIKVEAMDLPEVTFQIHCSKGTYIRVLVSDIGRELGCGGCLKELRRLRSGMFTIEDAISIDDAIKPEVLSSRIIPVERVLGFMREFYINESGEEKVRKGMMLKEEDLKHFEGPFPEDGQRIKLMTQEGILSAVGMVCSNHKNGKQSIKILRRFHLY